MVVASRIICLSYIYIYVCVCVLFCGFFQICPQFLNHQTKFIATASLSNGHFSIMISYIWFYCWYWFFRHHMTNPFHSFGVAIRIIEVLVYGFLQIWLQAHHLISEANLTGHATLHFGSGQIRIPGTCPTKSLRAHDSRFVDIHVAHMWKSYTNKRVSQMWAHLAARCGLAGD